MGKHHMKDCIVTSTRYFYGYFDDKDASEEKTKYFLIKFRTRLELYRKYMGYTQAELSEKSGVTLSLIQKYETDARDINKASVETVCKLAKALNCEMEFILDWRKLNFSEPNMKFVDKDNPTDKEISQKTGVSLSLMYKHNRGERDIHKSEAGILFKISLARKCWMRELIDFDNIKIANPALKPKKERRYYIPETGNELHDKFISHDYSELLFIPS